eukprot:290770-Chlamydomonas_euryale.AAC.2
MCSPAHWSAGRPTPAQVHTPHPPEERLGLLGFHRLVQAVAPAAARHRAPRELVDDDDLATLAASTARDIGWRIRTRGMGHWALDDRCRACWGLRHGSRCTVHGAWRMPHGAWCTAHGAQRMAHGG